jgi:hypothetical protein
LNKGILSNSTILRRVRSAVVVGVRHIDVRVEDRKVILSVYMQLVQKGLPLLEIISLVIGGEKSVELQVVEIVGIHF